MRKFLLFIPALFLLWPGRVLALGANLLLSPAVKDVSVGDEFPVDVILDTGGKEVSQVRAVVSFDTSYLSAAGEENGKTVIEASKVKTDSAGRFVLSTVVFKAKKAGIAKAGFIFDDGLESSKVVGTNKTSNLLDGVSNAVFRINSNDGGQVLGASTSTPVTGSTDNTVLMLAAGFLVLGLGIIGITKLYAIRN